MIIFSSNNFSPSLPHKEDKFFERFVPLKETNSGDSKV